MRASTFLAALSVSALAPGAALAYVGPGAGLTAIGTAAAFVGVILLLVAGFVWYPVKRLLAALRRRRAEVPQDRQAEAADDAET